MGSELRKAIDQISKDRGIDRDLLVDTLEEAVRSSVVRKYGDELDIEVNFSEDTGEIEVFHYKVVVDEVEDPNTEISMEDARQHDPGVQMDDDIGFKLNIEDLGRIAAQSAKQVIIQRMRDAEQEIIFEEYKDRMGEIVSGIIQRRDRSGWIINLGRTEALLPREEQIPKERYKRGDRVQGYIINVLKEGRGPQVILSRSHPEYMSALFRREVPEVADSVVKIMGVARDPGSRAKVAVMSRDRDVDPVGACVGIRGSRIQNIVQEFRGERIDIVVWKPDIADYARNALSPALITRITVDEEETLLEVVVPDDQLTLAIGRKGQNVKLASKLLGWKIDIFTESRYGELHAARQTLEQVANVVEINIERFLEAGFDSLEEVARAEDEDLLKIRGMSESKINDLHAAIKLLAPSAYATPADMTEGEIGEDVQADAAEEPTPGDYSILSEEAGDVTLDKVEDLTETEAQAEAELLASGAEHEDEESPAASESGKRIEEE
ncbi:transcription termination factor NusA [Desulfocurvibacter africanus]|uniref:Transcription termination/antitermination protein NusA n=1 Tax=Desulfocurvibacter africanus subsp. africanus str. Walvis Bay TaxID=690850 RepID=F3YZZ0_DESAF|nr:transcription termination factor NusA [Desulfocurvibacter africanus]EGJ52019.1 NusA antitermination factor [Desulfocurvibacter africanus subsp. africanus str. Walvis Bay]